MKVAGVDCGGSKVAVVTLDEAGITTHALKSSLTNRAQILAELGEFARAAAADCDVAYVEEPIIGRGVRASIQVAQTAGAVMSHLSVPSYFVTIGSWKVVTTGTGNASKGLVRDTVEKLHPSYSVLCGRDQDLIDALCIALYGRQQADTVECLRGHS